MALYRTGTASLDAAGTITGVGTKWRDPLTLIRTGATIVFLEPEIKFAVISQIVSDTEMKAITTDGATATDSKYVILLNDSLTVDGMAQDVAETLRYYQSQETEIAEAIEFFKDFDLKTLQDLVDRAEASAQKTDADRAATEQLKNDTQAIKDAAVSETTQIKDTAIAETQLIKDAAVYETNQIKADTDAIKTQTQGIKDAAVRETEAIKQEAFNARDESDEARDLAEQSKVAADSAKAGAETARDEARQWAQQVNPENLLHKDKNLNDLENKDLAREALKVEAVNSVKDQAAGAYNSFRNPDLTYELRIANNGEWRVARNSDGSTSALSVGAGGTGSNTDVGARKNLNTPIGNRAVVLYDNTDIFSYFINNPESGYYSCGSIVINVPEASELWMFNLHVHRISVSGTLEYGMLNATNGDGNKWEIHCISGSWGEWRRIYRSDNQLMLTPGSAAPSLGAYSIAIGDNDSGLKWDRDGHISAFADSERIFTWNQSGINPYRVISSYVDDNVSGVYVNGVRRREVNALIAGQVEGGSFDAWRNRASGMLVELPGDDVAVNVVKAVRWGGDWVASLDVARYSSGDCEANLNVRGTSYTFNGNGYASAVQWVNTSDIRLKANLKEIKSAKDKVKSIKGYTYFKRNSLEEDENSFYSEEAGVIAQDVQTVLPEAVYKVSDSEILGVSYGGVTALLVNAINEMIDDSDKQNETIQDQHEEIKELKNEIAEMKAAIAEMQAMFVQIAK